MILATFSTSARSVDMLGRQQIAGIPTAISEIFKNAYDAYATRVRGDFYPGRRILVIRDNGVGMTSEDFFTRWLTIGTDSKATGSALPPIERPAGMPERRQMGEKGIGRLAIATSGPQLLVATRARTAIETSSDHVTLALIQWTLFQVPGLTLDDVVIPTRIVPSVEDLDADLVKSMRDELSESIRQLGARVSVGYRALIGKQLSALDFDPRPFLNVNGPSLSAGSGTAFIVSSVIDDVDSVMETEKSRGEDFFVSEFQRFLLGFTNTISGDSKSLDFETEFVDHSGPSPRDVIDPESYFWESADFSQTDHTIEGSFDEYGHFSGNVSIYGGDAMQVQEPWTGSRGFRSACGPFDIKFGYVQGKASESSLTPETFVQMTARLEKIGGIYIYRDGIRVLPYGNSDNDYLEIEKRRSLNAGVYYFSYRRMFGAVSLSSEANSSLQEKAGREGFRENRAYRDFRNILQSFFIQIAADYFSAKSETAEVWRTERARLDRHSAIRQRKEQEELRARQQFSKAVHETAEFIESGRLAKDLSSALNDLQAEVAQIGASPSSEAVSRLAVQHAETVSRIAARVYVKRPRALALSRSIEDDWRGLQDLQALADETLTKAAETADDLLRAATERIDGHHANALDPLVRERLGLLASGQHDDVAALARNIKSHLQKIGSELSAQADASVSEFSLRASELLEHIPSGSVADMQILQRELDALASSCRERLVDIAQQAQAVEDGIDVARENVALKEQLLDVADQIEVNLELLQLGQAVQIVSHEFEASIRSVRNALKDLTPWARSTPRLQPIVRDLRASFSHLDGYLRLFTPLQRRLYRESVIVTGEEVEAFLLGVFSERLGRHHVELRATDAFRAWSFHGYPSTFYPTFVNIVDNAIHWVSSQSHSSGRIILDADATAAYVSDNGPGVRPRDRDVVFDRGFSRRRGGRGLGLSLARELLERDGWTLELLEPETGATFRIAPRVVLDV